MLDIKPYIPDFDSHGADEVRIPWWIRDSPVPTLSVSFSEQALQQLEELKHTFQYFRQALPHASLPSV